MANSEDIYIERPLRVGVFGEFSAGKSTLLNSLLNTHAQATGVSPTTQQISIIRDSRISTSVARGMIVIPRNFPLLRDGVELWDTPGTNSEYLEHSRLALLAAGDVDLALILVPGPEGVTRSALSMYERICEIRSGRSLPGPWVLITKWDRIETDDPEERAEVDAEIITTVEEKLRGFERWFRIDGRNLSTLDGPSLVENLQRKAKEWSTMQLVKEVKASNRHKLKREVALEQDWRTIVPQHLCSPELTQLLAEWEGFCRLSRVRRRRLRWRAVLGTPIEAVEGFMLWKTQMYGRIASWRFLPLVARALDRAKRRRKSVNELVRSMLEFAIGEEATREMMGGK